MADGLPPIIIDRALCVGAGTCSLAAPATFSHDKDGYATLLERPLDPPEVYEAAVVGCPVRALSLRTDDAESAQE